MAFVGGAGYVITQMDAYRSGSANGFVIGAGPPAPPVGINWLKKPVAGGASVDILLAEPADGWSAGNPRIFLLPTFRLRGRGGGPAIQQIFAWSEPTGGIGGSVAYHWDGIASRYHLHLYAGDAGGGSGTLRGEGTDTFAIDDNAILLVAITTTSPFSTTLKAALYGSPLVQQAVGNTGDARACALNFGDPLLTATDEWWTTLVGAFSNDEPATDLDAQGGHPVTGVGSPDLNDYAGTPDAVNKQLNVDDWGAGPADGDTSYNRGVTVGHQQSHFLTDNVYPSAGVARGVVLRGLGRRETNDKGRSSSLLRLVSTSPKALENDQPTTAYVQLGKAIGGVRSGGSATGRTPRVWNTTPAGATWTFADFDALQAGHRIDTDNVAGLRYTVLMTEFFYHKTGAVAAQRRRGAVI